MYLVKTNVVGMEAQEMNKEELSAFVKVVKERYINVMVYCKVI